MTKKLFVGGISYDTTNESLAQFFASAGTVVSAQVIIDRYSGRGKGFGFVEMSTEEEAEKAKNTLQGTELDGRKLNISDAKPQEPRDNRSSAGSRSYGSSYGGGNRGRFDRGERRGRNDRGGGHRSGGY